MLKPYQISSVDRLQKVCDLKAKHVLEIGGDRFLDVANLLVERGAGHVTSVNFGFNYEDREVTDKISTLNLDATKLSSRFAAGTFDSVFGIALLEHVQNLPLMLDEVFAALKPGAVGMLQGNPIWTSALGHHLWVQGEETLYKFNEPSANPIPPWHHLIFTKEELISYLQDRKSSPESDAKAIAHHVYDGGSLSRVSYAEMITIFRSSQFKKLQIREQFGSLPPPALEQKLNSTRWAKGNKFNVMGLEFYIQRT